MNLVEALALMKKYIKCPKCGCETVGAGTGSGGYIMAQMTLERAIELLQREYEKAQKLDFVYNPIAFALYTVWKMADDRGGER